jgi:hypothetical protein
MKILTKKGWKKVPPMYENSIKKDLFLLVIAFIGLTICILKFKLGDL